ncbi:choice-of-anchor Q domain-containing protein [Rhodohalobacter sp. 614A]|uniref:choice-of-anchor Q domain-containing protein n=1 Tax=Rhodohalobacter sp. 614A TaxID=2908649 RepID=UPI001F335448|nr:choice-of-anchor Q domain-containing protein [Rhodohalobacter sp. 614A]
MGRFFLFGGKKRMSGIVLFLALTMMGIATVQAQTIRYVKEGGTGNGSSWANASGDIQRMLDDSFADDEVWVAGGTYKPVRPISNRPGPNDPTNRDNSFFIRSNAKLYGGFAGNESSLSERDLSIKENETILSGDIDGDGITDSQNSHHVVVIVSGSLDGFTVTGGYANGSGSVDPNGSTAEIGKNQGGGIYIVNNGNTHLSNLKVVNNYAYFYGGGIVAKADQDESNTLPLYLTNVVISGNEVNRQGSALSIVRRTDAVLTNVTISGNNVVSNDVDHSAIYVTSYSKVTLRNSIIYGNSNHSTIDATNSSSESESFNSLIEGSSSTANGNIASTDPLFVNAPEANTAPFFNGDYRFFDGSAVLGAGNNSVFNSGATPDLSHIDKDISGNDRIQNGTVDLGAHEGSLAVPVVTNNNDSGPGSLRFVIENTFDGSIITFDESLNDEWIYLTSGQISIDTPLTLDASNLSDGIIISGNDNSRVFAIESGTEVTFRSLSITDGSASSAAGIRNSGDLTLENVTVFGNSTTGNLGSGGGIMNNGFSSRLTLQSSTISGNSAPGGDGNGGGIYNEGSLTVQNSTVSNNSAGASGGGILSLGGSSQLNLINSVIANSEGGDCLTSGSLSEENSFVGDGSCSATYSGDPMLNSLMYNGGPTMNHLPIVGSPLLDAGSCSNTSTDQRGFNRPIDLDFIANANNGCDIGSVEATADEIPLGEVIQPESGILYVDKNVSGGNENGSSWANAIPELRTALQWAGDNWNSGTLQIWVADGAYTPTDDSNRSASFQLINGVEIYGGFDATEDELSGRDWQANETILSGNIDGDIPSTNNSYHVVNGTGANNTAVLDGFTVTGGNADGSNPHYGGGGIFIYNSSQSGSPTLANLRITENEASNIGGGIYSYNSSYTLFNVEISENTARFGGGIYLTVGHPKFLNVGIYNNSADNDGGGINSTDDITLTNVTINNNSADGDGGGFYNTGNADIQNSILWGNTADGDEDQIYTDTFYGTVPTYTNSLVEDIDLTDTGIGNLDGTAYTAALVFANFSGGDYSLAAGSNAINNGDNLLYTDAGGDLQEDNDLTGNPRLDAAIIDMGAYEFQGASEPITPNGSILYVDKNVNTEASGYDGAGNSWANALAELSTAINWATNSWDEGTLQIWVAEGIYKPTPNADQSISFYLLNNVEIYGGFSGEETALENRDWENNATILSGDLDGNDDEEIITNPTTQIRGNNSYHVVNGSNSDETAVLDGFIITAGYSNGPEPRDDDGAGIFNDAGSPTLRNLIIQGNRASRYGAGVVNWENSNPYLTNIKIEMNYASSSGGGVYNNNSNPVFDNVIFRENVTATSGGGMYSQNSSSPVITNSAFVGNTARGGFGTGIFGGGGMYLASGSPILTNILFSGNRATDNFGRGGGLLNGATSPILTNVTFSGNIAYSGGAMFNNTSSSNAIVRNSIFWDNEDDTGIGTPTSSFYNLNGATVAFSYSLVEGHDPEGDGNLDGTDSGNNPLFVTSIDPDDAPTTAGDFRLQETSPVISGGSNSFFDSGQTPDISSISTDLDGNTRVNNTVDMGAYEFQGDLIVLPETVVLTSPLDEAVNTTIKPEFIWESLESADEYHLQVSENSNLSSPIIDQTELEENSFQPANDLDYSTTYYWRVRGINPGGTGEWSEVFTFTTLSLPEAADQRLLVSNAESYLFSGLDFGVSNEDYSIKIISLPDEGALQFNETSITQGQVILVADINEDLLLWLTPANQYGYQFTSFEFSIIDDNELESANSYTITIDLAARSVAITGSEGWRFLGNPSDGDSYDDLLSPVWTQGISGSDSPGSSFANVRNIDQDEYEWEIPEDLNHTTESSQPFIVYVYGDDDNDGNDEGFPKMLTSGENWLPLDGSFSFDGLAYNETAANPGNFYLLANPHPIALDFCEMFDESSTDIANNIDLWDPTANSGNGDYINLSCSVGEVLIAPFQAFWVRTTGENPQINLTEETYSSETTGGYFKQNQQPENRFMISLNVTGTDEVFSNQTRIVFSEDGTTDLDPTDGLKRTPEGLASQWLAFYSIDEDQRNYSLQNLPLEIDEKVRIPLDLQTTESGKFTMNWTLPESHIFNGRYFLRDNQTMDVIELNKGSNYHFTVSQDQAKSVHSENRWQQINSKLAAQNTQPEPRFELLITQSGVDGLSELGAVPDDFELSQNYPNPFNPTTLISYRLPVNSEVRLDVYDMLGRNVATLVSGQVSAGRHTVNFDASNLSSGIYLYRLQAGSQIITKKLTVLK